MKIRRSNAAEISLFFSRTVKKVHTGSLHLNARGTDDLLAINTVVDFIKKETHSLDHLDANNHDELFQIQRKIEHYLKPDDEDISLRVALPPAPTLY